jgi:hypothetical protein
MRILGDFANSQILDAALEYDFFILVHSAKHRSPEAQSMQSKLSKFDFFQLSILSGHEKKFKNDQNCKFGLNKINYLQRLIFAKRDFFSRPATLW